MKYTKILIEYPDYPDKFSRTILVKGNPDLFKLATFYAYILNTELYHCYYFETEKIEYVMAPFMESRGLKWYKYLSKYNLSDLPNNFKFIYDTGENYEFNSTILGVVDYPSLCSFVLLDAKGQGIWEDDHHSLYALLSGKIDPNESKDTDDCHLPWNFDNETFGDFFKEIDVDKINETLGKDFSKILSKIRQGENEYIEAYNMSLKDLRPDYDLIKRLDQIKKNFEK